MASLSIGIRTYQISDQLFCFCGESLGFLSLWSKFYERWVIFLENTWNHMAIVVNGDLLGSINSMVRCFSFFKETFRIFFIY
jgi:hypothetical protein